MTVEIYISELPENQKMIADFLRQELFNTATGIKEGIAYRLPFFYYHGPLCYFNPKNGGIDFGFTKAQKFTTTGQFLNFEKRKKMGSLFVDSLENLDLTVLRMVLIEAIEENISAKKLKKK